MRKIITGVTVFIVANSTVILAQEGETKRRFEGFYGGIEGGFDRTELSISEDSTFYYGLNLGYRLHSTRDWVFGIEGSFGDTNFDTGIITNIGLPPDEIIRSNIDSDFQWSAAVTFGKAFGSNLFFGKIGTVGSRFSLDTQPFVNSDGITFLPINSFYEQGYIVGLGYEKALTDHISIKLSLDYLDYNRGFEQFQPKAGINFKF